MMGLIVIPSQQVSATGDPSLRVPESELQLQMHHPKVMPIQYWDAVSICESSLDGTNPRWDDGGNFSGGLGIATSTWLAFGGRQFASTAGRATKEEQLIVANRISVLGYQTKNRFMTVEDRLNNRPWFQYPVSFYGWGCIKAHRRLHPDVWLRAHPRPRHR
jgi:hypothetical protein